MHKIHIAKKRQKTFRTTLWRSLAPNLGSWLMAWTNPKVPLPNLTLVYNPMLYLVLATEPK